MVFSFFGCKTADEDGPTGEGTTTITDIAGAAKKWHNDNISEDSGHTILQLTDKGFTTLETKESANEGRAVKLSEI